MKKYLTFLVLLITASVSFSASVSWQWVSGATKFDATNIGTGGTGYLLYIGSSSINDYSFDEYVSIAKGSTSPEYVTTAASKAGKINTKVTVDSGNVGNYVSVLSYTKDSTVYWNVSSSVYNLSSAAVEALLGDGTAIPDSSFTFAATKNADDAKSTIGGGWYVAAPVPEPATGALALAGIALLLKRRKAVKA